MPNPKKNERPDQLSALKEAMELAKQEYELARSLYERSLTQAKGLATISREEGVSRATGLYKSSLERYKTATMDFNSYLLDRTFPNAAVPL